MLNIVNDKRNEIYLLQSTIETSERELKFWIYDFDYMKLNVELRVFIIS